MRIRDLVSLEEWQVRVDLMLALDFPMKKRLILFN